MKLSFMPSDGITAAAVLCAAAAISSAPSSAATDSASAPKFPTKPIRIVTAAPGAVTDAAARLIAEGLTRKLGQQVIVDNRGGASGVIAAQTVAQAGADGHTLLFYSDPFWLSPLLQKTTYDPVRDFAGITLAVASPNVLVVHPSMPGSVKELIALARAKPGQLNYASGSTGAVSHLAAELFKSMAGVSIVRISYKGAGPGLIALMGNEAQLMFPSASGAAPHVKSGKLKALGVASLKPSALAPGLPTLASSGLPGFEARNTNAMFAPAKTPAAVVRLLNDEIVQVVNQPDVKKRLFDMGVEPVGGSPAELAATVKSEMAKWGRLIKDAGIKATE